MPTTEQNRTEQLLRMCEISTLTPILVPRAPRLLVTWSGNDGLRSFENRGAIHSTKISGNFGPKLNWSVLSNRKSFEKTGPPFEVVLFSRSDRSEVTLNFGWMILNGSRPRCSVAVVSSVAVWSSHLPTNRMGFCFFQSKYVVIVSSSCDFPARGGLYHDFCSFQCPDRVEDLCMKQFWSVFPDGFLENFTEVWGLFETFLGQRIFSYVGELESLGQGWKHNQRFRRRTVATRMYFRASEVRCYSQYFQRRFYMRIRVMVQISSS